MNLKSYIYSTFLLLFLVGSAHAQKTPNSKSSTVSHFFNSNIDYSIQAHFSIGGSSPMGFPQEIRKINSYNPTLQLGLEANATKWLDQNKDLGIRLGIAVEGKGMSTSAEVKNYFTEIIQDNSRIKGYYTGTVQTDVSNTYLSIPVSVVYKISSRWNVYGGLFAAFAIDKRFDGYVSEGYLRQDTPVGAKIAFENDSKAAYDFSNELKTFNLGAQAGAEWRIRKQFKLFTNLNYGFNNLFNSEFTSISFPMHNIYLDLGFGYSF